MTTIKPFERKGFFTAIDNAILDQVMPTLTGAEWKVLSFILRKTVGWQKESDKISISQIKKGAGVSRNTAIKAANSLHSKGIIIKTKGNATETSKYSLNVIPNTQIVADYKEYLKSPHWKKTRAKALKAANYSCQLCNAKKNLHVHHNTYDRLGKEKPRDLIVLCANCHAKFHDKLPKVKKGK